MSAVAVQAPRRLHVVADRPQAEAVVARTGRRTLVLALMTALVIVAAVFGIVGLNAMAANASVEASRLEREVAAAEIRYAELIASVAAKEDPGRIRERAMELGLVPSTAARHLRLSRGIPADGSRHPDADVMVADALKPVLTQGR